MAEQARDTFCRTYWYPIYAYLRRDGNTRETAEDLTQGFFTKLLEPGFLTADPKKGKFRSLLISALKNFVLNNRRWEQAEKRGGKNIHTPLEFEDGEERYIVQTSAQLSSDQLYDRSWAEALVARAEKCHAQEYDPNGNSPLYSLLLPAHQGCTSYEELAGKLGLSVEGARVKVCRFRKRFSQLILEEVTHTVSDPAEALEELRYLLSLVAETNKS